MNIQRKAQGRTSRTLVPLQPQILIAFLTATLVVIGAGTLIGCGGSAPQKTTLQTPTRFVNALSDVPTPLGVDLVAPSPLKQEKITFGGATAYKNVDTGTTTFTANQNGTESPVVDKSITLEGVKSRTVVAVGVSGSPDATLAPRLETLSDGKIPSDLGSNAAVRLVVLASRLDGPVDLFKDANAIVGATNITSGNPSGYAVVATGAGLSVHDKATGVDLALTRLKAATLTTGKAYTIIVIGRKSEGFPADLTGLDVAVILDN